MSAIFKREFSSYMRNVTGPLFIAMILLFEGIFYTLDNLLLMYSNFEYSLGDMQIVLILAVPILAMRSLAEDKRSRVDQLLYSLPMSLSQVVLGKYLAMLAVFGISCGVIAIYPLILSIFGTVNLATAYCSLFAFFLLGAALLALCMFLSSLTESQIIAAVIGVGGVLLLYLMDSIALLVPTGATVSFVAMLVLALLALLLLWALTKNIRISALVAAVVIGSMLVIFFVDSSIYEGMFREVLTGVSLFGRFSNFNYGIFDIGTIVYNLSFIAFFLYLTYQVLEKKRWS
ncbi:MAG: ABC transporter permease [Clostridia bacterium]|nr:ABC transporter permease [Clostridia bacterium]